MNPVESKVLSEAEKIRRLMMQVGDAQKLARGLVDRLSAAGDPQTGDATMIFQRLTAMSIALFDVSKRPSLSDMAETLAGLSAQCSGALKELKGLLDRAAATAHT